MPQTINTNLVSLNAQRVLSTSQLSLATSMQRLSSGLRVNSAKDDAAGLAIAERMHTQVRGMNVAMRNANDGISMAQVGEGALGKTSDMFQRMRELAVQSANGTNTAADRISLNEEYMQLAQEVTRTLEDLGARSDGKFQAVAFAEHARLTALEHGPAPALEALDAGIAKAKLDLALPASFPALRQAAALAAEAKGVEAGLARVDAVLAKAPGRADLLALRANFLANAGRYAEARSTAQQALAANENEALAHLALGLAARGAGDAKGAVASFDRALALDATLSDAGYFAATTLITGGQAAAGRERLEHFVRLYPDHAGALNDLAWMLAEDGQDLGRAEKLAEQATRLSGRAEMFDTFGYVRLKQERFPEAARAFRLALQKNADYTTARYHLALALERSGDRDGAKLELKQALASEAFPEAEAARSELARLERAAPASQQ